MFSWLRVWWEEKQRKHYAVHNGSPQSDDYEQPALLINHKPQAEAIEYEKHDRQYKDRQILTNILIVVFTAFTAMVAVWQGVLSTKALLNSEQSSRTDQRAWISVAQVEGFPEVGKRFSVSVVLENTGKTPALEVEVYFGYQLVAATERPSYKPVIIANQHSSAAMFPNSKRLLTSAGSGVQPMTEQNLQPVKSGEKAFYVFGECRYRDIFNRRHWTKFCYHLRYIDQAFVYVACREHNDIDGQ